MKKTFAILLAAIGIVASSNQTFAQDHGHLNVGAAGTNQNDPLTFDNGADFATNTGYVCTLLYTNGGKYSGYYNGNITLTALATTTNHAGPVANAPADGSYIYAQFVSVDGPPGGVFAFWESGATVPTFSLASGATGTNTWKLSENNGVAGTDPFGHIHGRRFTATKPGIYTVGFRAWDYSTNGVGGVAIHTPSEALKIYFQAGINIATLKRTGVGTDVFFGARAGRTFALQATATPSDTNSWTTVSDTVLGNDYLQTLTDTNTPAALRVYRIKDVTP